jgi:hypothetical protein
VFLLSHVAEVHLLVSICFPEKGGMSMNEQGGEAKREEGKRKDADSRSSSIGWIIPYEQTRASSS